MESMIQMDWTGVDFVSAIASIPALIAVITMLRDLGLPSKLSPIVAMIIGVALQLAVLYHGSEPWFGAIAQGIIFSLAASGVYDISKLVGGTITHGAVPQRAADEG